MPAPDTFPHAEERRLLYVALTRARDQSILVAPLKHPSPFIIELIEKGQLVVETPDGSPATRVMICPGCRTGTMTSRNGRYGPFLGCTNFPACDYTRKSP